MSKSLNGNTEKNSHVDAIERKEEVPLLSFTPASDSTNTATKNNSGQ